MKRRVYEREEVANSWPLKSQIVKEETATQLLKKKQQKSIENKKSREKVKKDEETQRVSHWKNVKKTEDGEWRSKVKDLFPHPLFFFPFFGVSSVLGVYNNL